MISVERKNHMKISDQEKLWAEKIFEKIDAKLQKTAIRSSDKLPYTAVNGIHDDKSRSDITWWTNGFWPGLLWMMYGATDNRLYRESAEKTQKLLHCAFEHYDGLHHDVGFMWHISSGLQYRLTGDQKARMEALYAANLLAGRFNAAGGYLRAWNSKPGEQDNRGWAIIDCMMNITLLYWASRETGDERFASIAKCHADKTMNCHVREDGSVRHIVEYDPASGTFIKEYGGQGYGTGSSWSRGQAWGIYGFALSYYYTGDERYLNTAKKIAHYFISCVCSDWLPRCDFRAPEDPVIYDSTAGAIASCGFLTIAEEVPENEKALYYTAAVRLLQAMETHFCDWSTESDAILKMGTERYNGESGRHIPIIYGDYFLIQAILKLCGREPQCW
jgi:unsaturated chondroitin disaccharide hydrolase